MKQTLKKVFKNSPFKIFITVLIGVIAGAVAFNHMQLDKDIVPKKRVNFLFVLNNPSTLNSDSIMIMSCDPAKNRTTLVSIPPNTLVSLNGSKTPIGSIYSAGGAQMLIEKVTEVVPVPINNYVAMDYKGLRRIVDCLGDVTVNVPYRMDYYVSEADIDIDLRKGMQKLNSEKAEMYMRYNPEDSVHTLKREENHREFVKQIILQNSDDKTIGDFSDIFSDVSPYITTDIATFNIDSIVSLMDALKDCEVHSKALEGIFEYHDNRLFFVANYENNINILN